VANSPLIGFHTPQGVAVDPNTGYVYVVNSTQLIGGHNDVTVINPSTGATVADINLGGTPTPQYVAVSADGHAYVTTVAGGLKVIDPVTFAVHTVSIPGGSQMGVAVGNDGQVYVVSTGQVHVYDPSDSSVTAITGIGVTPQFVAVDPNNGMVYVTNEGSNTVSVINPVSNTVTSTISVGAGNGIEGIAVQSTGAYSGYLYVAGNASGQVSVINPDTGAVVKTITGVPAAFGVAIAPTGTPNAGAIYVTSANAAGTVTVIDPTTNQSVGSWDATPGGIVQNGIPHGIAVSPLTGAIWVAASTGTNTVNATQAVFGWQAP